MPDASGAAGRLSVRRARNGGDEGQGKRAHLLAGGRGPLAPAQEGRVPGTAAGTAAGRRQAPEVGETEDGEGRTQELAKGPEDHHERAFVQVTYHTEQIKSAQNGHLS